MCRDFEIELPRLKIGETFKKASINNQALEYDEFKTATRALAKEYCSSKFSEEQARLKLYEKVVAQLNIPQHYENPLRDKAYHKKVTDILKAKQEKYNKYVES